MNDFLFTLSHIYVAYHRHLYTLNPTAVLEYLILSSCVTCVSDIVVPSLPTNGLLMFWLVMYHHFIWSG